MVDAGIHIEVLDPASGHSRSLTVHAFDIPTAAGVERIAQEIERHLGERYRITSLTDRRHKRRRNQ